METITIDKKRYEEFISIISDARSELYDAVSFMDLFTSDDETIERVEAKEELITRINDLKEMQNEEVVKIVMINPQTA